MGIQINDEGDLSDIINNVFGSYFIKEEKKKFNRTTCDVALYSYDKQGRTFALSNKAMDAFYTYENVYIFLNQKISSFKEDIKQIYEDIIPTLPINKDHYETIIDLILFAEIDKKIEKEIDRFLKTKLIHLGLNGHITIRVIGIDLDRKIICGHKSANQLKEKMRKEMFNYE